MMPTLKREGFAILPMPIARSLRARVRDEVFHPDVAGVRCLLDQEIVRRVAGELKNNLVEKGVLAPEAVAIQAIAFNKTSQANWLVTWHQDVMFPFARAVTAPGFELAAVKDGIHYARPPVAVLEHLLAVRFHLDDCGPDNGPLRVSSGTHRFGVLMSTEISPRVAKHGEVVCAANEGDALLMKPLLLHASSRATAPANRRVLHIVFYHGPPIAELWHRALAL